MNIKKTLLTWLAGILIIIFGLSWATAGSVSLNWLFKSNQYFFDNETITKKCINNGLEVRDNEWIAQIDDASFMLKLPRRVNVKEIRIDVDSVSSKSAQIYYSPAGKQMDGSRYWEMELKDGENVIVPDKIQKIEYLRFDLTDKEKEKFILDNIQVITTSEQKVEYCVFVPIIILLFMIGSFGYINKEFILVWINKDEPRHQKFDMYDQIFALSVSDFKGRFSGSYLGIFWGVIQPLSTILLFWFVFQVGFRSNPIDGVPFILWLAAGMIPWNYFYDAWFNGTETFHAYGYIVKKVVFNIEVLPLVKALSSAILNLIFNGILIVIYCLYGRFMGFHLFDMLYFSCCLFVLTLGLSYITATLNVFIKDVGQFMGIMLQILMWMTPLMWSYDMIPEKLSWIYKLNPLHYILNGYRESLINGHWFYYHWKQMIWFWIFTLVVYYVGRKLMNRMKDHFADVL